MAEFTEQAEGEFAGVPGSTSAGLDAAMELAVARRRGKAKPKSDDPELDSFLRGQARLAELQAEHLHEQRGLILTHPEHGPDFEEIHAAIMAALPDEEAPAGRLKIEQLRRDAMKAAERGLKIRLDDLT